MWVALVALWGAAAASEAESPVISTETGAYRGAWDLAPSGLTYMYFLGIKYATATRFKAARMVDPSAETFEASEDASPCLQLNTTLLGQEDCLTLNVYTPNATGNLPVVVYIHGGRWLTGSASPKSYGPQYYMATGKVVLVVIQYRLGPLGFLDFNSENYPPNLGLRDQLVALQWVQTNIGYFGGDSARVTLQGQSAGGASVHLHMLSPLSRGLMRSGISESGSACAPFAVGSRARARENLRLLARTVGCREVPASWREPADVTALCLANRTADQLVSAFTSFFVTNKVLPYHPVLEEPPTGEAFIREYPWTARGSDLPWISGTNSFEMSNPVRIGVPIEDLSFSYRTVMSLFINSLLPNLLTYRDTASDPSEVTRRIKRFYLRWGFVYPFNAASFIERVSTDNSFVFPNHQCHGLHAGDSWNYLFGRPVFQDRTLVAGTYHGEELNYILPESPQEESNVELADRILELWVNFVYNGVPTAETVTWSRFQDDRRSVLLMSRQGFSMERDPNRRFIRFWQGLPFRDLQGGAGNRAAGDDLLWDTFSLVVGFFGGRG